MRSAELFTFPWPGPGNSEGPVDPDGWTLLQPQATLADLQTEGEVELLVGSPWPGPGDSEG